MLLGRPLARDLESTSSSVPQRAALITADGKTSSWAEVRERSLALAARLMEDGIGKGDRVAVWLPNTPVWVLAWAACSYLGAVVVPVSTRYKADEVRHILAHSRAKALVMCTSFFGIDYGTLLDDVMSGSSEASGVESLSTLTRIYSIDAPIDRHGVVTIKDLAPCSAQAAADVLACLDAVGADDDALIVYTSGTTGRPKGAVHTAGSALRQAADYVNWMDIEPHDVLLAQMPFFHVAGLLCGIAPAVQTGATVVLMETWDPDVALRLIESHHVTHLMGAPTHYRDLVSSQRRADRDLSGLKRGWIGGAATTEEVVDQAVKELGLDTIMCVFGMTEAPMVLHSDPTDSVGSLLAGRVRVHEDVAAVGIFDPDGARCPVGVEGEIRIKGEPVLKRYFDAPEETAAAFDANGWFRTGDLGVIDEDDYVRITGRLKDMFIVGGTNAYPAEIEAVIDAVRGVRQSQVVGVPDRRLGEVGFAFVELDETASELPSDAEIIAACERSLAKFKVPSAVRFVREWPMTPSGKIQKFHLREEASRLATDQELNS